MKHDTNRASELVKLSTDLFDQMVHFGDAPYQKLSHEEVAFVMNVLNQMVDRWPREEKKRQRVIFISDK